MTFPLKNNPFFAKSMSQRIKEDGIEDKDGTGYGSCNSIGNLKCSVEPNCLGNGYIDCTGGCPGEESEFFEFQSVMKDKAKLKEDYPALSKKMEEGSKNKTAAGDRIIKFLQSLTACTNFSPATKALLSLVTGGFNFEDEELDIQKVHDDAISGFGDYEYYEENQDSDQNEKKNRTLRDLSWMEGGQRNDKLTKLIDQIQNGSTREKRSEDMNETTTKCVVKNLKCSRFPRLDECTGIGVGKCGAHAAILKALSSPYVLVTIVVLISLLIFGAVSTTYYVYKKRSSRTRT